jgi:hypothetical protein
MKSKEEINYEKIMEMLREQNKTIKEIKDYLDNMEKMLNEQYIR